MDFNLIKIIVLSATVIGTWCLLDALRKRLYEKKLEEEKKQNIADLEERARIIAAFGSLLPAIEQIDGNCHDCIRHFCNEANASIAKYNLHFEASRNKVGRVDVKLKAGAAEDLDEDDY